eukprot:6011382-Pleurochrysis_carterae.AAC.1
MRKERSLDEGCSARCWSLSFRREESYINFVEKVYHIHFRAAAICDNTMQNSFCISAAIKGCSSNSGRTIITKEL